MNNESNNDLERLGETRRDLFNKTFEGFMRLSLRTGVPVALLHQTLFVGVLRICI